MSKNDGFRLLIASPYDYERLVCEIYYQDLFVALVSQETALGEFKLETPGTDLVQERILRKVEWSSFRLAVDRACEKLRQ